MPSSPQRRTPSESSERGRFQGRKIVVTGGSGTIGSEIVRQLLADDPAVVRVLSRDETRQAEMRQELGDDPRVRFLVGDIRDLPRLQIAFAGVDTVFHAAALKHVPACEYNPFEAVQTNVVGTQNVIQACRDQNVKHLVAISTDKAVNPVNTMGATKLLSENLVRSSQEWNPDLKMSVVRFGNVLGSRGSLLPILARKIDQREALSLTHRDMTRFMMTIGDAVSLVLAASEKSRGGELFVLDMPALKVRDLVRVFAEEYSIARGIERESIRIEETTPRAGEKMHEDLVTEAELPRLAQHGPYFVVQPSFRQPVDETFPLREPQEQLAKRLASATAPHLDDDGIRDLIRRSGFLDGVVEASDRTRAKTLESEGA